MTLTEISSPFSFKLLPMLGTFFAVFIAYWFFKIVVRPLYSMQFYKKQGIPTIYFPLIGKNYMKAKDLIERGDMSYWSKYGDKDHNKRALCSNLGLTSCITLFDAGLIKEFYLHPENYIREHAFIDIVGILEGKGMFMAEGDQWKAQRKILSASFNFEFLKAILGDIQKLAYRTFSKTTLNEVDATILFQEITADVMGSAFFGEQVNDYKLEGGKSLTRTLAEIMSDIGELQRTPIKFIFGTWIISKGILPKYARSVKTIKNFRKACDTIIEQRRKLHESQDTQNQGQKHKDMVETLLDYRGEEGKLSNERIVDEFITFYAGGTDTTSHLLTMTVCQMIKYPEAKAKLIEEIRSKYDPTKEITIDELGNLEYVTAFIKETLRTMTPAPGIVPRRALRDHKLLDISIKKGDYVDLDNFYPHYNAKYFEDPEAFKPERWLVKNPVNDPYAFTPFSAGQRNCIGQHLAMNEAKIILCEFLSMYDFEVKEGFNPKFGAKFTYAPVDPVLLNLKNVKK